MNPTELFVYGTLRHDQPEHAKFCRGVTGWRCARLRGRIWLLPSGYRLLVVPPAVLLQSATQDAAQDEVCRRQINPEAVERAWAELARADLPVVEGEVLAFSDAIAAWPPLDAWEEFSPGRLSAYLRAVVPVRIFAEGGETTRAVWAYVASRAPAGAVAWA